jgi:ATP-binding cassette subfamily G (WHITE) protein 2 (SNQ2)
MPKDNAQSLRLTPLSVAGMVLITFGTALRMRCYQAMKTFFTFDLSIHKNHRLVTTGPYSVVRHPSYSGMLAVYIGMGCWFGSRGSWLRESGVLETTGGRAFFGSFAMMMGGVLLGLFSRMSVEDGVLRKRFGEEWVAYARRVHYSLIPWVY